MSIPMSAPFREAMAQGQLFSTDIYRIDLSLAIVDGQVVMAQVQCTDPPSGDLLAMRSIPSLAGLSQSEVADRVRELLHGAILAVGPFGPTDR